MDDLEGWLTSGEACARLGIKWRTLYSQHRNNPDFPKPRKLGRTLLWPADQLDAWRAAHPKRRRRADDD